MFHIVTVPQKSGLIFYPVAEDTAKVGHPQWLA